MAVSVAKTSTAPGLLKESDITEASDSGRKPAELRKVNLLFWQQFERDRVSTARKTTVCLHQMILWQRNNMLLFSANYTDPKIQYLISLDIRLFPWSDLHVEVL